MEIFPKTSKQINMVWYIKHQNKKFFVQEIYFDLEASCELKAGEKLDKEEEYYFGKSVSFHNDCGISYFWSFSSFLTKTPYG